MRWRSTTVMTTLSSWGPSAPTTCLSTANRCRDVRHHSPLPCDPSRLPLSHVQTVCFLLPAVNVGEDCPVFDGLFEFCQLSTGGSVGELTVWLFRWSVCYSVLKELLGLKNALNYFNRPRNNFLGCLHFDWCGLKKYPVLLCFYSTIFKMIKRTYSVLILLIFKLKQGKYSATATSLMIIVNFSYSSLCWVGWVLFWGLKHLWREKYISIYIFIFYFI